jgi:membrane protein involved in colicin uptake
MYVKPFILIKGGTFRRYKEGITMSDHDNKKQKAQSGKGILGGLTGLTDAAKEAAEEAEDNARTPVDRIKRLADSAREAAEQAKRQHQNPIDRVREIAQAAQQAAENARKQAETKKAIEAAQRADQARNAEQAEEKFHGSGGVGSEDQMDDLRRAYRDMGIIDPSGLTMDSDDIASNLDVGIDNQDSGIQSSLDAIKSDDDRSQGLSGGRNLG